jgi:hypothetical protein
MVQPNLWSRSIVRPRPKCVRIYHVFRCENRPTVNGCLVYPLQPSQFRSVQVVDLPCVSEIIPPTIEKTWIITEKFLNDVETHLYNLVRNDEETRFKIPAFGPVREGSFPYRAAGGTSSFINIIHISISTGTPLIPQPIEHSMTSIEAPSPSNAC